MISTTADILEGNSDDRKAIYSSNQYSLKGDFINTFEEIRK